MPTFSVATDISVDPATAYDAVSDLPGHARWAADPLEIVPLDDVPLGVGKRYRSTATSKGKTFTAALEVTELSPPSRLCFTAVDATGRYRHEFSITPTAQGVRVERTVTGELSFGQRALFALVYLPVKRPNARRALSRLRAQLENAS